MDLTPAVPTVSITTRVVTMLIKPDELFTSYFGDGALSLLTFRIFENAGLFNIY